jgi:hypothetical protein
LSPNLNFVKKNFFYVVRLKTTKNFFCKCILEFDLVSIAGSGLLTVSKYCSLNSLYPIHKTSYMKYSKLPVYDHSSKFPLRDNFNPLLLLSHSVGHVPAYTTNEHNVHKHFSPDLLTFRTLFNTRANNFLPVILARDSAMWSIMVYFLIYITYVVIS